MNAKSTGVFGLVKLKMYQNRQGDKMKHPCIATEELYAAAQLLHQPNPMRWGSETLPLQKVLQAALATLLKNKRWGKEAESDSPKANTGCKIQSKYRRSFNIWMRVHSTTWLNRSWAGFAGRWVEETFYLQGLTRERRGTGNSDNF